MEVEVTLEMQSQAALGEGPFWHPGSKRLYWLDIEGKRFHVYDPIAKTNCNCDTTLMIGAATLTRRGGFVVAAEGGFYQYDPLTGNMSLIVAIADLPAGYRLNDGKCDPAGRFWAGTVGPEAKGALYCLDTDLALRKAVPNVTVSNGLAWSADKDRMYYIDSATQSVVVYTYDNVTSTVSEKARIIDVPKSMGIPDGMTMDAEGMLWIALWGGKAITRWNPQTGELIGHHDVPALNVTSCAFGGEDLDTLYVT